MNTAHSTQVLITVMNQTSGFMSREESLLSCTSIIIELEEKFAELLTGLKVISLDLTCKRENPVQHVVLFLSYRKENWLQITVCFLKKGQSQHK